jgi:hypothetical protein
MTTPNERKAELWRQFQKDIGADKRVVSSRTAKLVIVLVVILIAIKWFL